ncbi:MAG: NAD(P)-dependent oxidoreductase [Lachnospiraceae bacterium]|nr:NAD(P)-dependent oxidoreductase [Lachnospiraceae bacterium]
MSYKIIITGATSFIGNALIRRLCSVDECKVYALVRPNSLRRNTLCSSANVEIIEADMSRLTGLENVIDRCDALIHVGWNSDFADPRYNLDGQMKNVDYMKGIVELAARTGCNKLLCVGSQAECGRVNEMITENTPDHPETAYAIAKCRAFEYSLQKCEQHNIKLYWPRLLSAYGPNDKSRTLIMSCLNAAKNRQKIALTPCEQMWDFIYVDDVAEAILRIIWKGEPATKYPISSGTGNHLYEYIAEIARITQYAALLEGIGQKDYAKEQVMYLVGDISRLCKDTGFYPKTSFAQGISATWEKVING